MVAAAVTTAAGVVLEPPPQPARNIALTIPVNAKFINLDMPLPFLLVVFDDLVFFPHYYQFEWFHIKNLIATVANNKPT